MKAVLRTLQSILLKLNKLKYQTQLSSNPSKINKVRLQWIRVIYLC